MSFIARSIAAKVAVAFSLVIITLVVIYIIMAQRLDTIGKSIDNVTEISSYSTSVIRINKDIIEMQRDVSVYSSSGSDAVFAKINDSFQDIENRVDALLEVDTSEKERQYIESLSKLVAQIGDNLNGLSSLYKSRSMLIDVVLEDTYQSAIQQLSELEQNSANVEARLEIVELMNRWHLLHRDAGLFLSKKDYQKRKAVNAALQTLSSIQLTSQREASDTLQSLAREYQSAFVKSVQVNRNYFNLVNVVMAGNTIEFGNLANRLREQSLARLQDIKNLAQESISTTQTILNLLGSAIILYLIFLACFFHLYITKAITRLTLSFSRFLKGDLSAPIQHTHRGDEIGVLAQAASRFRDMSKDLEIQKQAAEHTSRVKSEFLANMSHEIRTPMNGILGMTTQLSYTNLDKDQKEMLDIIASSGESLLVIINDILDLSKIDADKIELEERPVILSTLLNNIEQLFKSQASAKGIQLSAQVLPIDQKVVFIGDETRLKQILMNLVGNAIKFTGQGHVALNVEIKANNHDTLTLLFSVTDSGIGIEPENIEKLFDAFSQADTSITRKFGGTGLGLTITSKLLSLMGSELKADSEVNKGSRFYFEIDVKPHSLEKNAKVHASDANIIEGVDYSGLNVLIAEDNETNQIVIRGFLSKLKVGSITVAENGEQAVELCEEQLFDLVFMDMQMPVKDGLQATLEIKAMEKYHQVPIVALTANVLDEDKKRCADVGMCDFVSKPVDINQLASTLDKWS